MLYNREPIIPLDLLQTPESDLNNSPRADEPSDDQNDDLQFQKNLKKILEVRDIVHDTAAKNIKKVQQKQKYDYSRRHEHQTTFQTGDKVLLRNLKRSERKGHFFPGSVLTSTGYTKTTRVCSKTQKEKS